MVREFRQSGHRRSFLRSPLRLGWRLAAIATIAVLCSRDAVAEPARPLYIMNSDGTGEMQVAAVIGKYACGSPSWSPDGSAIAFDAHGSGFSNQHVLTFDLQTEEQVDLGPGGFPSWSPDGKRIAFHRFGRGGRGVWIANADGSNTRLLFENASHPRWSPDGKSIAFLENNGDNLGLYNVETGQRRLLFDEPTGKLHWGQSWSPDGKRLALTRSGRTGADELLIISAEGTSRGMRIRYRGDMSTHTSWSSDGEKVLVGIYGPGDGPRHLHHFDPDSREGPVALQGQDPDFDYCDGAWSPNGEQVAFSRIVTIR